MSPALRGVDGGRRARARPELRDEVGQSLRPARIADHDVIAVRDGQPRDLAADMSRADESDGLHVSMLTDCRLPVAECRFLDCRVQIEIGELPIATAECRLRLPSADWNCRVRDPENLMAIELDNRQSRSSILKSQSAFDNRKIGTRHSALGNNQARAVFGGVRRRSPR